MKLTRSKLLKIIKYKLAVSGYQEFSDSQTGASRLFVKLINGQYFLTLGLIISNNFDTRFTASYYLSKTTRWSSVWGDIPPESYQMISRFLTEDERCMLLSKTHNRERAEDGWWSCENENELDHFFQTIDLSEKRFLNQERLFMKVEHSVEVRELIGYSSEVIALVQNGKTDDQYVYQFIPKNCPDDVPLPWFRAAEIVLLKKKGVLNLNTVKLLAADAWRQYKVIQLRVGRKENFYTRATLNI